MAKRMGRNPYSLGGESMTYHSSITYSFYPPYKHKKLNSRKSLIASVNGRKTAFNNLLKSEVIKEDELEVVNEIIQKLDYLSSKIKENNEKDKVEKPILRFSGTGSLFKSI
jgi:hypothetical protein